MPCPISFLGQNTDISGRKSFVFQLGQEHIIWVWVSAIFMYYRTLKELFVSVTPKNILCFNLCETLFGSDQSNLTISTSPQGGCMHTLVLTDVNLQEQFCEKVEM